MGFSSLTLGISPWAWLTLRRSGSGR